MTTRAYHTRCAHPGQHTSALTLSQMPPLQLAVTAAPWRRPGLLHPQHHISPAPAARQRHTVPCEPASYQLLVTCLGRSTVTTSPYLHPSPDPQSHLHLPASLLLVASQTAGPGIAAPQQPPHQSHTPHAYPPTILIPHSPTPRLPAIPRLQPSNGYQSLPHTMHTPRIQHLGTHLVPVPGVALQLAITAGL
jgi:hypothetical protein